MSKGLGRVQREIDSILKVNPDSSFTIEELCERIYGYPVEKRHRVAVLRASKSVPLRNRAIVRWKAETRGGTFILINHESVMSYATARLKVRGPWPDDDYQARKRLRDDERYSKLIVPGGTWWLHVQEWIAERDNDQSKLKELEPFIAKQKAESAAATAALMAMLRS